MLILLSTAVSAAEDFGCQITYSSGSQIKAESSYAGALNNSGVTASAEIRGYAEDVKEEYSGSTVKRLVFEANESGETGARAMYYSDATGLKTLLNDHPEFIKWLGKKETGIEILRIGAAEHGCDIEGKPGLYNVTERVKVPVQYKGENGAYDPYKIAEDYDIVMFCAYKCADDPWTGNWSENDETSSMAQAIADYGNLGLGGVFLIGDYYRKDCAEGIGENDLDNLNLISKELGVEFKAEALDMHEIVEGAGTISTNAKITCECGTPCDGVCLLESCADIDPDCRNGEAGEACCVIDSGEGGADSVPWGGTFTGSGRYHNFDAEPTVIEPVCVNSFFVTGSEQCTEDSDSGTCSIKCEDAEWSLFSALNYSKYANYKFNLSNNGEVINCSYKDNLVLVEGDCDNDGVCDGGGENEMTCPGDCCSTVCDGKCADRGCYLKDPDCRWDGLLSSGCCTGMIPPTTITWGENFTAIVEYDRFNQVPKVADNATDKPSTFSCTWDGSGGGVCTYETGAFTNTGTHEFRGGPLISGTEIIGCVAGEGSELTVINPCNRNGVCEEDIGENGENCLIDGCCSTLCDRVCEAGCAGIDPDCGWDGEVQPGCCKVVKPEPQEHPNIYVADPNEGLYTSIEFERFSSQPVINSYACGDGEAVFGPKCSVFGLEFDPFTFGGWYGECSLRCDNFTESPGASMVLSSDGTNIRCVDQVHIAAPECNNDGTKDPGEIDKYCEDACSRACDGICGPKLCFGEDPDCDESGHPFMPCCGNSKVEAPEVCDRSAFDIQGGCEAFGFDGGELACMPDLCSYDVHGCTTGSTGSCSIANNANEKVSGGGSLLVEIEYSGFSGIPSYNYLNCGDGAYVSSAYYAEDSPGEGIMYVLCTNYTAKESKVLSPILNDGSEPVACTGRIDVEIDDWSESDVFDCGNGSWDPFEECDIANDYSAKTCDEIPRFAGFEGDPSCSFCLWDGCYPGSECVPSEEVCDGEDNDCDGLTDTADPDLTGVEADEQCCFGEVVSIVDSEHCGSCGNDCGELNCIIDVWTGKPKCSELPLNCGNGVYEPELEECDPTSTHTLLCSEFGLGAGTVRCNEDCTVDLSFCQFGCGNGIFEPERIVQATGNPEECDTDDFGGETCNSLVSLPGFLSCTDDCQIDTGGCFYGCGNGIVEGFEECDTDDLDGATCESLGEDSGTLKCKDTCEFDTSECGTEPTEDVPSCIVSSTQSPIDTGDSSNIVVSYNNFLGVPNGGLVCGAGASIELTCGGGICSATCPPEKFPSDGDYIISAELTDGVDTVSCGSPGYVKVGEGSAITPNPNDALVITGIWLNALGEFEESGGFKMEETMVVNVEVFNYSEVPNDAKVTIGISASGASYSANKTKNNIQPQKREVFRFTVPIEDIGGVKVQQNYDILAEVSPGTTISGAQETELANNVIATVFTVYEIAPIAVPEVPLALVAVVGLFVLGFILRRK